MSSNDTDQIIPALVGVLAEFEDIPKTRTADMGKYQYRFADLKDVLGYVRPRLKAAGLAVKQTAFTAETGTAVTTTFLHESGQWIESAPLRLPTGNDAQSHGSAVTFARRYQLLAELGLATEDDDGAAASKAPKRRSSRHGGAIAADQTSGPSSAQTRKAMALFAEVGRDERSARLAFTSAVLDRDVASWSDVSGAEARQVIDALLAELGKDD